MLGALLANLKPNGPSSEEIYRDLLERDKRRRLLKDDEDLAIILTAVMQAINDCDC